MVFIITVNMQSFEILMIMSVELAIGLDLFM